MLPVPVTVRLEGPVILRLLTVADTLPLTVALPVCSDTVGPVTVAPRATERVLAPGVAILIVFAWTVAPAITLIPPALAVKLNELPAPSPAVLEPRFTVPAKSLIVAVPDVFAAKLAA